MKRYDSYKDSGVQWIGEIPSHWEVMKTSLLYNNIGSGTTPSTSNPSYYTEDNGGFFWLQTGDLNDGLILDTSKKVTLQAVKECRLKFYPQNSVVIAMYGATIGKVGLLKIDTTTNQACCVLPHSKKMNEMFSFYLYQSAKQPMLLEAMGGGQPNISQNIISKLKVPAPPLSEQQAIATYLDKKCGEIDKAIATQQKRIELLQELRQNIITHAITRGINPDVPLKDSGVEWIGQVPEHWEVCKTLYVLSMPITDGPHETPTLYDSGIPFISAEAVSSGEICFDLMRGFISESYYSECCKKYVPQKNDIYMIKSGATTGRIAMVKTDRIFTIWSPLAVFRANDYVILHQYLYYTLKSDYYQRQVELNWSFGTQQNIGMRTLEKIKITFPPIKEQQLICSYLNKKCGEIDSSIAKAERQISLLQELKQSIITEVVTGKRKVC